MNFLHKINQHISKQHKRLKICSVLSKFINQSIFKQNKRNLLNIGLDGFFPKNKWKMSKKVIGGLIIVIFSQFFAFFAPIMAQNALADNVSGNEIQVFLDNGAKLNELEKELINQKLIIIAQNPQNNTEFLDQTSENVTTTVNIAEEEQNNIKFTSLGVRTMSSYNSEPAQTDDTPCITANGFDVCAHGIEDTVAANFLPFGAQIKIPDLFGDRIFIVRDRMNQRYPDRIDIWMLNKADSKIFGLRRAEVQLLVEAQ